MSYLKKYDEKMKKKGYSYLITIETNSLIDEHYFKSSAVVGEFLRKNYNVKDNAKITKIRKI